VLFEEFQPDGALPRDDGIVIEGMHEGEVLGLAAAQDSSYASS